MFTGIIEEIGVVQSIKPKPNGRLISIRAHTVIEGTKIGDSIAIDGACQTVTEIGRDYFTVFASDVTIAVTTFRLFTTGTKVNLERAVQPQGRLGGHLVQGHVDAIGKIVLLHRLPEGLKVSLAVPNDIGKFIVPKGSIAIDGISLTVVDKKDTIELYCIPETIANTTLAQKKQGDMVNIEVDIIAKYVYYMLQGIQGGDSLLEKKLKEEGFWQA